MMKHARFTVLLVILLGVAVGTAVGCGRPKVGTAGYKDPMADQSAYRPADEFKYLVDIKGAADSFSKVAEQTGMTSGLSKDESEKLTESMGLPGFEQDSIMAEANDTVVHARGTYHLTTDDYGILESLAKTGPAEIKLPGYFPGERWIGHFFLAKPGALIESGFKAMEEELNKLSEQMPSDQGGMSFSMNMDFFLGMYGFGSADEVYGWMGDEAMIFNLSNPDFDPDSAASNENVPIYTVLAVSSKEPEKGLDMVENFWTGMAMSTLFQVKPERKTIGDYEAVVIPPPSFENSMFEEMVTQEQKEKMKDMPSTVAVAVPGYFFVGDQTSVEKALALFDPKGTGTGRMATLEGEWNLDLAVQNFTPGNPGVWLSLLQSEALKDVLMRLYNETKDLKELGVSRTTVVVTEGRKFELDMTTTRESIKLLEIVKKVAEETPDETWEQLGEEFGKWLKESSGAGAFGPMGSMGDSE